MERMRMALTRISFVRGAHTPRPAHSALPRAEDLLCGSSPAESQGLVSFVCSFFGHISLRDERRRREIKINK
jgi:hypothetical protein